MQAQRVNLDPPSVHVKHSTPLTVFGNPGIRVFDSRHDGAHNERARLLGRNNTTGHSVPPPLPASRERGNSQSTFGSSSSSSYSVPSSSISISCSEQSTTQSTSSGSIIPSPSLPQITVTRPLSTITPCGTAPRHVTSLGSVAVHDSPTISNEKPLPALPSMGSAKLVGLPSPATSHTLTSLHSRLGSRRSTLFNNACNVESSAIHQSLAASPVPASATQTAHPQQSPIKNHLSAQRQASTQTQPSSNTRSTSRNVSSPRLRSVPDRQRSHTHAPRTTEQLARSLIRYLKIIDQEMDREFSRLRVHISEAKMDIECLQEERAERSRARRQYEEEMTQKKVQRGASWENGLTVVEDRGERRPPRLPTMVFPVV